MIDYHLALGFVIMLVSMQWFALGMASAKHDAVWVFPSTLVTLNTAFIVGMVMQSGPLEEISIVIVIAQIVVLLSPLKAYSTKVEN